MDSLNPLNQLTLQLSSSPINFNLSTDLEILIEKYDYFLFDCDGVLWKGNNEVDGAFTALRKLQQIPSKKIFMITNSAVKSRQMFQDEKLKRFGFDNHPNEQIYTSAYAAAQYFKISILKSEEDSVYVLGERGLKDEFKTNGIRVSNQNDETEPAEMSSDEIASIKLDPNVKAVVVGMCYRLTYRKICLATLYLQVNKAVFIQTNPDKSFATAYSDRFQPGGGSIAKAVEAASLEKPFLIGKPKEYLFDLLRQEHNLEKESKKRFLMIGDSLVTDILFANNCEIDSLLVLTGVTSPDKAQSHINSPASAIPTKEYGLPTYIAPFFGYQSPRDETIASSQQNDQ